SQFRWFGQTVSHLHVAIDDASGNIVGAYFAPQETLKGYYQVLHQILTNYGIPAAFLTDRRTVFDYQRKGTQQLQDDTM
ncbi:ISNCY family transposase, partial [Granulicatella sp. 19428wC4_WM01]|nr:ISNCY family transposase [Granulicatella sp. 19428wC4_WM01]